MESPHNNHLLHIAICEDHEADAYALKSLIESISSDFHIDIFASGEEAVEAFTQSKYHVAFFDIYLNGIMDGLHAARHIRQINRECCLVFTTISREHALESYELEAAHYLVKPLMRHDVQNALERCQKSLRAIPPRPYISVTKNRKSRTICCDDIQYAEIFNKECLIHTDYGIIAASMSIDDLSRELPSPPFLRCHRSYIVNMDYIDDVDRDFLMKNGDIVYIRQTDARRIKNKYAQYLIEHARKKWDSPDRK